MKRFLMLLTIALTSFSLFAATAEAKRFGGGGSIGKQRSMTPQQAPKAPAAAPAPAQGATPAPGNKWMGPLAGLAIGAGLGALFASIGLGGGMGMILMIILVAIAVFALVSMFRKRTRDAIRRGRRALRQHTATRAATFIHRRRRACDCGLYAGSRHPRRLSGGELSAQRKDFVHPPASRE